VSDPLTPGPVPVGAGRLKRIAGATAIAIMSRIAQIVRRSMLQVTGSGNWIISTGIKRVAAHETAYGQPAAPERAVPGHRLESILGARGIEAATGREQRREQTLVRPNEPSQELPGKARDRVHRSPDPQRPATPVEQIRPKRGKGSPVRFPPGSDDEVPRRLVGLQLLSPDLAQLPAQTIAGHRGRLKFRNDQSHPRVARRVVRPNHVQILETAAPALGQAAAKIGRAREPMSSRQARRCRQEPPCFEGSEMASFFRPFLRRRESTARPQREAIRARNPCRLILRLLRGRYDGFMKATPPK